MRYAPKPLEGPFCNKGAMVAAVAGRAFQGSAAGQTLKM
jgi:hypothetical protein